ncbi:MAG: response regulator transcription factor [Anaerolineales bacterium]|nr:response regulator transcription factor [Anaerolineales bacterium]
MNEKKIQVLVVDAADPETSTIPTRMRALEGIEVVGVANNRNTALAQIGELEPAVLVVDLMLPGIRSIDLIRRVAGDHAQVHILALVPADPPHDRIMLAAEAGALGYVCQDADLSEFKAAIEQVHIGEPWLPRKQTYEVLQDGASELALSTQERRGRLTEVLLGIIPLAGLVAAMTAFLWRRYWGDIGVRVADLGIDPSSRMIDVLVVFVTIIGIVGPLLFVRSWVKTISKWISGQPRLVRSVNRVRSLHVGKLPVGRLLTNFWIAWLLLALVVLFISLLLFRTMPLIMGLFIGPAILIILIANVLDLDDELPNFLHLPNLDTWRVLGFLGVILVVFLLALGVEVLIKGPDLRVDGVHGFLAPKVLGFKAIPVMLFDLDEKYEPLGALYLGGNADLYVLYDPCAETVRLVPVGASRVELIDQVDCRSP